MDKVTRRDAFVAMAAGAAAASGALPAPAASASSKDALSAVREAALRAATPMIRRDASPVREARVLLCRSWDRSVYFYLDDRVKGFSTLDEAGFAIAAACQAADRPVALRYWGHSPEGNGVGRFDGVLLAVDPRDLESGTLPV